MTDAIDPRWVHGDAREWQWVHGGTKRPERLPTTSTCCACGGRLPEPVPAHYDYEQRCDDCIALAVALDAWRPRTLEEHRAYEMVTRPLIESIKPKKRGGP